MQYEINLNQKRTLTQKRAVRLSIKGFYPKMLFDPFEESFYLPTTFVQFCNGESWKHVVVRQKIQVLFLVDIVIVNTAQFVGIIFAGLNACQQDCLIGMQTFGNIGWVGVNPSKL